jgi:hypothetical protein
VAYVRTVKTASGATAVQIVHAKRRGARRIEHVGSAHEEQELQALKTAAAQRLAFLYPQLDLGLDSTAGDTGADQVAVVGPGPLPIMSSRAGSLWDGLAAAYDQLGFDQATGRDGVFRQLVLARIIEPTSKQDSLRVLDEVGVDNIPSYATLKRRLPSWATEEFRHKLAAACARHAELGPASLVLYDVSTLYFETDTGDGFREPGFSKERRLEPQITIGLLTDATGFPLMVEAFEGNTAEMTTMLPTITAFMAAHQLADVTVVADAGMICDTNKKAIEAAKLSFILGMRTPDIPYVAAAWQRDHDGQQPPDGLILTQPWPAGPRDRRRDEVIYYQYRADRAAAACTGSTSRSPRPNARWLARSRSSATASSASSGPTSPSTELWRPRRGRWLGGRATSPTSPHAPMAPPSPRSSSSAPTTGCSTSRPRSACPSTTWPCGRSTTTSPSPSRPT